LGPGLSASPSAVRFVSTVLPLLPCPVVIDADGLNAVATAGSMRRNGAWIMTPHEGEAARLLSTTAESIRADRSAAARALSRRFGAVAVLKGARTLVTDGDFFFENETGNPGMASGGMGDVLTGMIAAFVAQVRASSPEESCVRAAAVGVWLHGRAGDAAAKLIGPVGFCASDVAALVPSARGRL
jgi:NAD(P)H-hydrate epimerase